MSMIVDRIGHEFASIAISAAMSLAATPVVIRGGVATITATTELELVGLAYWTSLLGYTGSLTPGDRLVIDTDAMTVKLNGSDARANFTGSFPKLWPGSNELRWTSTGDTPNVSAEIDHEPRWA